MFGSADAGELAVGAAAILGRCSFEENGAWPRPLASGATASRGGPILRPGATVPSRFSPHARSAYEQPPYRWAKSASPFTSNRTFEYMRCWQLAL